MTILWNFIFHVRFFWWFESLLDLFSCLPHDRPPGSHCEINCLLTIKWVVFRPHLQYRSWYIDLVMFDYKWSTLFRPFSPRGWVDQELRDSLKRLVRCKPTLGFFQDFCCNNVWCQIELIPPTAWRICNGVMVQVTPTSTSQISAGPRFTAYSAAADDEGYWSPPSRYRGRCLTRIQFGIFGVKLRQNLFWPLLESRNILIALDRSFRILTNGI